MIAIAKKDRKILRPLAEKVDKVAMIKVAKIASAIDNGNLYRQAINNNDIDAAGNLKLTDVKKY